MPRTKAKKPKPKISDENIKPTKTKLKHESINCFFKAVENDKKLRDEKLHAEWEGLLLKLHSDLSEVSMRFPLCDAGKTLAQLKTEKVDELRFDTTSFKSISTNNSRARPSIVNDIQPTTSKNKDILSRSRARATTAQKTVIRASSLPRNKLQQPAQLSYDSYVTPLQKSSSLVSLRTITPKIKPNTPQVVLRRPKEGEVALSMQGSPLMVSSVSSDVVANVNIPLHDGRILTIQPERGLRPSLIPYLDLETQQQIETLRDNLNKVCAMHTRL